ncbi:hypothetical protein [Pseudomonas yamanorum]|uniref:hypothetical protein n=1 Tax=Pseudomonas yamanorum TaxID=515393 RepID=UPI003B9F2611
MKNKSGLKMQAKWSDNTSFNPLIFIKLILESASINDKGNVQYEGFKYFENKAMLRSMVLFEGKESISPKTEDDIFDSGLATFSKISKKADTNLAAALLMAINKKLQAYLAREKSTYLVATSISIMGNPPIKKIASNDVEIKIIPSGIPQKFKTREQYNKTWKFATPHTPSEYSGVVIKVEARTVHDAMHAAIDEVDFARGIFSFFANASMTLPLFGSTNKGINRIRLGGLHSIHTENGAVASEHYWYEPDFAPRDPFTFKSEDLKFIALKIRKIIKRINLIKGGSKIRDGIIRYVRALDEPNSDHLVIKLWGALESTVGQGDKSDIIIKRCSYLYKDQELVRQILEVAKVYRNRNVHGSHSSKLADQIGYQLHSIFTHLIFFYVGSKDLVSVAEANSFLDSPLSSGDLERKIFLLKKAIRFRS